MKLKPAFKIILMVVVGTVLIPLLLYFSHFGSLYFSSDFEKWVDFSVYWSPYLVFALTVILAFLSWQNLEVMKLKEKPILVVENRFIHDKYERKCIRNVGSGSALRIKMFIQVENTDQIYYDPFLIAAGITCNSPLLEAKNEYQYMVHSFNLIPNEEKLVDWQQNIFRICIVYSDLYNSIYSLLWINNTMTIHDGDLIGVDENGCRGKEVIFSSYNEKREYKQVFSFDEASSLLALRSFPDF